MKRLSNVFVRRSGYTLVEVLVAMCLFMVVIGLTAACLCSSMALLDSGHQVMRAQELGKLFLTQLENELRGASLVKVSPSGKSIAFRLAGGDAIAYVYDDERLVVSRYVRSSTDRDSEREDRVFPNDLCVRSCSFHLKGNSVAVELELSDREKQDSNGESQVVSLQGRASLRPNSR